MADHTGISWADATFNPWVGCAKVSPGCANCYAETLVQGRMGRPGTWGENGTREVTSPGNWQKPRHWNRTMPGELGRRPRVFCASLADVFEDRPEVEAARFSLFELIEETSALDWLVLTKRPEFARDWLRAWYFEHDSRTGRMAAEWVSRDGLDFGCPPNLWIGASIENSRHTYRADVLREIPAAVRFVSAEPLLGSLFSLDRVRSRELEESAIRDGRPGHEEPRSGSDALQLPTPHDAAVAEGLGAGLQSQNDGGSTPPGRSPLDLTGIDWVIVGGESGGRSARAMHPQWFRELRDACADHGVAFHGKQWGSYAPTSTAGVGDVCVDLDGQRRAVVNALPASDSAIMRYAGPYPTSGGKRLDGKDHCAFPELVAA